MVLVTLLAAQRGYSKTWVAQLFLSSWPETTREPQSCPLKCSIGE